MNRKRLCLIVDVASLVICLIPLAWFLLRASKLPDVVPVHFGFGNVPTRFGSKWEYLFMPLFSIGVIIFWNMLPTFWALQRSRCLHA